MMMDDGDNGVDNDECWPHIIYPIYILGLMLFPPQDVFSRAGAWVAIRIKMFQNHDAFTQRSFNTEKLLHTETFAHRNSEADAHRHFYAKKSLQRSFYTQKLWVAEEGKGGVPSCARCAHGPTCGSGRHPAILLYPRSHGGGESEARTRPDENITSPCGYFSHAGTSPIGLLRHVA